jgi:hypothetical protein
MLLAAALGSEATTLMLSVHGAIARPLMRALHTTTPACVATKLQLCTPPPLARSAKKRGAPLRWCASRVDDNCSSSR